MNHIISVAAAPLLSRWLFGIEPIDAATILASLATVTVVALIASQVPARRTGKADPSVHTIFSVSRSRVLPRSRSNLRTVLVIQ